MSSSRIKNNYPGILMKAHWNIWRSLLPMDKAFGLSIMQWDVQDSRTGLDDPCKLRWKNYSLLLEAEYDYKCHLKVELCDTGWPVAYVIGHGPLEKLILQIRSVFAICIGPVVHCFIIIYASFCGRKLYKCPDLFSQSLKTSLDFTFCNI